MNLEDVGNDPTLFSNKHDKMHSYCEEDGTIIKENEGISHVFIAQVPKVAMVHS